MSATPHRRYAARRRAELDAHSRCLKRESTASEALLWQALVSRKLGVAFRRQEVLAGRWIADFVAPSLRLVVELDGSSHRGRERADARRDEKLHRLGYRVLRIPAKLVMVDLAAAVRLVAEAVQALRR